VRTVKQRSRSMDNGLKRSHEIRRPYRDTKRPRRVCAVSRSCLVQRPRSFIDSLLKAVQRWYTRAYQFPCVKWCTLFGYAPWEIDIWSFASRWERWLNCGCRLRCSAAFVKLRFSCVKPRPLRHKCHVILMYSCTKKREKNQFEPELRTITI